MSLTKLATFYIAWLGIGSILAGIGWYFLGRVASEKRRRTLRALLLAAIFGFGDVGFHGGSVILPGWWLLFSIETWPEAIFCILLWWGVVYLVMFFVSHINAKLQGSKRRT